MPIANWLKSKGYKDIVLFLAIGKLDIFLCMNLMKSFKFNISTTTEHNFFLNIGSAFRNDVLSMCCISIIKVLNLGTLSLYQQPVKPQIWISWRIRNLIKNILGSEIEAQVGSFDEKNQRSKILCYRPFNANRTPILKKENIPNPILNLSFLKPESTM